MLSLPCESARSFPFHNDGERDIADAMVRVLLFVSVLQIRVYARLPFLSVEGVDEAVELRLAYDVTSACVAARVHISPAGRNPC